jgi:uncharacterized repeat protein (TIGR01451 family)
MLWRPLLAGCLFATAGGAQSLDPLPIEVTLVAEQLLSAPSTEGIPARRFEPARQVRADQEVHYTVRIRNTSDRPLPRVVVTRPIPDTTVYVPGSAVGPAAVVTFSIDGGQTFDVPERLRVAGPDAELRNAEPVDYTTIRWELGYPLAARATAMARFRVTLR